MMLDGVIVIVVVLQSLSRPQRLAKLVSQYLWAFQSTDVDILGSGVDDIALAYLEFNVPVPVRTAQYFSFLIRRPKETSNSEAVQGQAIANDV
jgi:hypothetical protein